MRVGSSEIAERSVKHWARVITGGRRTQGNGPSGSAVEAAARFLISSQWLIGQAAASGVAVSPLELDRAFAKSSAASFPGGEAELRDYIRATGEAVADQKLELQARMDGAALRRWIVRKATPVSVVDVANYYRKHLATYAVPEQREVRITNRKTKAAAIAIKRRLEAGASLLHNTHRETFGITHEWPAGSLSRPLMLAIAAAKPNTVVGPVKAFVDYNVFVVTKIVPPSRLPLRRVGAEIRRRLEAERRHEATLRFTSTWGARWMKATDCRRGYLTALCRQSHDLRAAMAVFVQP